MTTTDRAVLYARVSSDDRHKEGRNLESQIEMCQKYAQSRHYTIAAELSEDDRGASGASFELPQLNAIRNMAERKQLEVLVVREIDRLSRNLAKQLIVEEELKRAGVRIEYVLGEYPDTPEGNLQKNIKGSIAEYEREKIRERTMRAKGNIVKRGHVLLHGDRPPYGYRATKDRKQLVIYEPEARIVRQVYDWYTIGDELGKRLAVGAIAQKLSRLLIPTWRDVRGLTKQRKACQWSKSSVEQMLHNQTYAGTWTYGKRRDKGGKGGASEQVDVPVPAIIDLEIWQAAQAQAKANQVKPKNGAKHEYLMNTHLTCNCGYAVEAMTSFSKGHTYGYYFCNSAHNDLVRGNCGLPFYRVDDMDDLIWQWMRTWLDNPATLEMKLNAYLAEQEKANGPIMAQVKIADDLIKQNKGKLDRLLDLYLSGAFDTDVLEDRKLRLTTAIAKLEQERTKLAEQMKQTLAPETIREVTEFAAYLHQGLVEAEKSFAARKRIIELLDVKAVLIMEDGERVVYPFFPLSKLKETRLVMGQRPKKVGVLIACE